MCSTGVLRTRGRGKKVRREAWDAGDVPRRGRVQLQAPGAQEQELLDRTLPKDLRVYV